MKILTAVNAPSRHLFPLFVEWRRMGHEVLVVVDHSVGRLGDAETYRRQGLEILTVRRAGQDDGQETITLQDFRRRLGDSDAVVVGGYAARSARMVLGWSRTKRPPTVLLAERPDQRTTGVRRVLRDAMVHRAIRRTDAVWAMSETGRAHFEHRGADVTILAPYPLPSDSARTVGLERDGNEQMFRIAVIGRLDDGKDPLMAARSLSILARRGLRFEATFYGDGPLRDVLALAIRGIPARLAGHVQPQEIQAALDTSDVLLHTSRYDGWGMVIAEAVAAEVAVVAGRNTDSATEFARIGPTVCVVNLDPERIALELESISQDCDRPAHRDALRSTRMAAERFAGAAAVARRTIDDLERRVLR